MSEPRTLGLLRKGPQRLEMHELVLRDPQPAEPIALVRVSPQRRIMGPQPAHFVASAPFVERGFHRLRQGLRKYKGLPVHLGGRSHPALSIHRSKQLVKGVRK